VAAWSGRDLTRLDQHLSLASLAIDSKLQIYPNLQKSFVDPDFCSFGSRSAKRSEAISLKSLIDPRTASATRALFMFTRMSPCGTDYIFILFLREELGV
jgi:hypothetical protein